MAVHFHPQNNTIAQIHKTTTQEAIWKQGKEDYDYQLLKKSQENGCTELQHNNDNKEYNKEKKITNRKKKIKKSSGTGCSICAAKPQQQQGTGTRKIS